MLFSFLLRLIRLMSPELRQALCQKLAELQEAATHTSNDWDDEVISFIRVLLGC